MRSVVVFYLSDDQTRGVRWARRVVLKKETRNACRVLIRKREGKRPLGKYRCRWAYYIEMELKEMWQTVSWTNGEILSYHWFLIHDFGGTKTGHSFNVLCSLFFVMSLKRIGVRRSNASVTLLKMTCLPELHLKTLWCGLPSLLGCCYMNVGCWQAYKTCLGKICHIANVLLQIPTQLSWQ